MHSECGWLGVDYLQGLHSLSGKPSYSQISWSLEAARLVVILIVLLWNLTGILAALLPRCRSNIRAIWKSKPESRGFDFDIIVLQHFHMMTSRHGNAFGTISPSRTKSAGDRRAWTHSSVLCQLSILCHIFLINTPTTAYFQFHSIRTSGSSWLLWISCSTSINNWLQLFHMSMCHEYTNE